MQFTRDVILASYTETPVFGSSNFDVAYLEAQQRSLTIDPSPTGSEQTLFGDQTPLDSREHSTTRLIPDALISVPIPNSDHTSKKPGGKQSMADEVDAAAPIDNAAASAKPRRVRTGCLTCRERHLKCDEALPHCLNCRKSSRICKRGVRLNFIDTQVQDPPLIPPTQEWSVHFQDESREIAAEYRGGLGRYAALELDDASGPKLDFQYDASIPIAPTMSHQQLPPIQHLPPPDIEAYPDASQGMPNHSHDSYHQHNHSNADSTYSTMHPAPQTAYSDSDHTLTSPDETRDYLTTPDEVLYMQVFVEEVGLWMDSMDPHKHVSG